MGLSTMKYGENVRKGGKKVKTTESPYRYYDDLPRDLREFLQNAKRNYSSYKIWKFLTLDMKTRKLVYDTYNDEVKAALKPYLKKVM